MANAADLIGTVFAFGGYFYWFGLKAPWWRVCGWFALCNFFYLISDTIEHDRWLGVWNAINGAYALWAWWTGGGGTKTKKRLKSWARKFSGVRRTAPQLG